MGIPHLFFKIMNLQEDSRSSLRPCIYTERDVEVGHALQRHLVAWQNSVTPQFYFLVFLNPDPCFILFLELLVRVKRGREKEIGLIPGQVQS